MENIIKKIIKEALLEDTFPYGDITSQSLINKKHLSSFELVANQNAVLSGIEVFKQVFFTIDKNIEVKTRYKDGSYISKNTVVTRISGCTMSILKGERTALNFISHLSGISTLTKKLVKKISGTGVILLDTRKTTPNLRLLEREAVLSGGGKNHRFNLSDMVLIKDNHIAVSGGIRKAVLRIKKSLWEDKHSLKKKKKIKIEVEVNNIKELKDAISMKPDVIMFDNWNVRKLKNAVKLVPSSILTEASGLISPSNIQSYAKTGVNYISTGYMVKNAKWVDFSLNVV